ncbi:MAG TPA: phosphoadenosine phosphosulfate reductase family protein [Polyangiaceae bacterium]|nr:phosphoadenosine phosphosulfate reductase family protein [Polyangiaceae bacterium]
MSPPSLERLRGRHVVLSVSGGADSAATSLYLKELGVEHERVFADTGWEHPATYEYLRGELTRVLGPIREVSSGLTLPDLVRSKAMFPSRVKRFCTLDLKVKPLAAYVRSLDADVVNAVGIRAAESQARARLPEWEWNETFDCDVWRPILSWSKNDVVAAHKRHGLAPNPLYLRGFSRVGCWPCIFAQKEEIRRFAELDPARVDEIRSLEGELTRAAQGRRGPQEVRSFFQAKGDRTERQWPIDRVVAWARDVAETAAASRGGRQLEMFAPQDDGCVRWGMCEGGKP